MESKTLAEMSVLELKAYYYDQLVQKDLQEKVMERIEDNLNILKSEIIQRQPCEKPEEKKENV